MVEIWKDVEGYAGIYEVSNLGRVRTHKDKTTYTEHHGVRRWKQRILKPKTNGRDFRVTLWKDGKPQEFLVHRLVAFAFIPKIKDKNCINHKDGNPKNNNVENLEWCTYKENQNHAFENDLVHTNLKIKLTQENSGIQLQFISMSKADKWLKRATGYISQRIKSGHNTAIAKDKTSYLIEKVK